MFSDAQWFFLNETDSTNNVIQQKLAQGHLPEGSVVVADYQSQGKGQRGSVWQSKPGENLLFSMVLYPLSETGQPVQGSARHWLWQRLILLQTTAMVCR
ncbi:MAG: hypothetical protein R2847_02600 [Bacteroidia bacterium]